MEMYTGPEQRATETYMIPGAGSNPHLTYLPQLEEVNHMGNEMAPDYIFDQGMYYPAANYYGYYCTGFESPGECDDHNRFFGLDGQDLRYSGLQTESLPYVYYTPSYGYSQSPYNPYNPYIPGAVIGLDGPYIGTQQYVTDPSYQPQLSSPGYIPVVVQPTIDVPNSAQDPSLFSAGSSIASRHVSAGVKYTPPLPSTNTAANSQRSASGNPAPETSQSSQSAVKSSEGSLGNMPPSKQSLPQGTMPHGSAAHETQIRNSSASTQVTQHFSHGRAPSVQNPLKVTMQSNDGFTQFGSNVRGWATADKFRPRLHFNGILNNPTGSTDILGEQNKGPRTSRSKSQWTSTVVDGDYPAKSGASNVHQTIVIGPDQFNMDNFPVNYPDAKFFVIKSYSEDDVHKSIKYNVWSSTPNGNKRLDSAYEDAQRISVGRSRNCPIFLFFSVNASGQFCGVAEMIGPVDFNEDMDFWQQDKWTGSFMVKWHIIKDVPNTSFRHIILENNENKPVTNSRDTQEIPYIPGLSMLNIFKSSPLKTSILDDFMFYEERERIMQEEKARLFGRRYDASQFVPAVIPGNKICGPITQPTNRDENQSIETVNEPSEADEKQQCDASDPPPKADGNQPNVLANEPEKSDGELLNGIVQHSLNSSGKPLNGAVYQPPKSDTKPSNVAVSNPPKADGKLPNHAVDQPAKADGKLSNDSVDQPPKADIIPSKSKDPMDIGDQPPKADRNPIKIGDYESVGDQPPKADIKDPMTIGNQPPKADRKDPKSAGGQPSKVDKKDHKGATVGQPSKADRNPSKPKDPKTMGKALPSVQVTRKPDFIKLSIDKDANPEPTVDSGGMNSTIKTGSRTIDLEVAEASISGATVTKSTPIDVVTIGSMRIKVKGLGESSSSIIGSGGSKINKQGTLAGSQPHQK